MRSKESPDQTAYDLTAIAAYGLLALETHIRPPLDGNIATQGIVEAKSNLRDQGSGHQVRSEDAPFPQEASHFENGYVSASAFGKFPTGRELDSPESLRDYIPREPPPRRAPIQIRGWNINSNKIQRHRADQSDATNIDSSSLPRDLERFLRQNLPESTRPAPSNTIESGNTIIQSAQTKSEPREASATRFQQ